MEFWPCSLAVFLTVIVAAIVDRKADAREGLHDIIRSDPVIWIFRVVVIAIHRKAVAANEIIAIAVAVLIFGTDIIMADSSFQAVLI
ncbi:hypothetical protein [[Clostridium] innocuum]|uniref:hypothetical protein n=1 Tax=Clostridium innocuum TaxID=1522 RepID=UPI0021089ABD|nr:hypothetical protein [[Clostridium] innocuum]